ncbi:FUSC family protein [Streptomyces prasinopilosus]|uniref:FUSC family protein n=1 Tax=Streptomyces prasinopilosus TaxID=67344 RepID=UPI0006EBDBE8|nr:FUSC family protein [Streptomyces prasinopilosus]
MAHRTASRVPGGGRRTALDVWLLLQATASAAVAWLVARYVFDHPTPYFAPIAAMIALTADLGERGLHAVRLLLGVLLGLLVGQLVLATLGTGPGAMAFAVFVSLSVARAVRGPQIVVVQAAVSAILVVAAGDEANGFQRLVDVLTGAGIALVFSQLLFPPEPLALLRRAETEALTAIAGGLTTLADAIDRNDDGLAARSVGELREILDHLVELRRVGRTDPRVTRRALAGRAKVVVREKEHAEHLDLLGASCLMLARLVASAPSGTRARLQEPVRELRNIVGSLAGGLDDRDVRQRAADRALELATRITTDTETAGSTGPGGTADPADLTFLAYSLRTVATDVIAFAGVDLADALEAIRTGALDRRVAPTRRPPGRLGLWARRLRNRTRRSLTRGRPSGGRP